MRAVLLCAGSGERWGDYLGVTKHLIPIDGEPLLHRTVRQLREIDTDEIVIIGPYDVPGTTRVDPLVVPENGDFDKLEQSRPYWSAEQRTLVVYGDVFFSDAAMGEIADDRGDWRLYCRPFRSSFDGTPFGEPFVQSFHPDDIRRHGRALDRVLRGWHAGRLTYGGAFVHYQAMLGITLGGKRLPPKRMVVIDDETNDFDMPFRYERWLVARSQQ